MSGMIIRSLVDLLVITGDDTCVCVLNWCGVLMLVGFFCLFVFGEENYTSTGGTMNTHARTHTHSENLLPTVFFCSYVV